MEATEEETNDAKLARLNFLLDQTSVFSEFLAQKISLPSTGKDRIDNCSEDADAQEQADDKSKKRKRCKTIRQTAEESAQVPKKTRLSNVEDDAIVKLEQPAMVTGGQLREYQLRGVSWITSLFENGLNGILADEMGLGKTIQTIAFLAHLYTNDVKGPFLIVGPLSTLANWVKEIQQWTPDMPVLLYHGTKEEREAIRSREFPKTFSSRKGIVVTSFEMIIRDKQFLHRRHWKYLVVDEGHRIKNLNCRLIRELKSFNSANRLLLTGTPLQNSLCELWALLSFLMPQIFDDLDSFQRWFDFDDIGTEATNQRILQEEQEHQLVTKLHRILRPFMLRRVKADVEIAIPPKAERIIHASLTQLQQKYYQAIMNDRLRDVLDASSVDKLRCQGNSLQNKLMQLRKCCNHPYLFEWPLDDDGEELVDEGIVQASGKMQILDKLLPRLLKEGHKVLLFSQMTRMLDIVQDYLLMRGYRFHRIDGSTPQPEREQSIEEFNSDKESFCFLLSTRAGGLGINLTAADVVVFIDSDWNPQIDLQAQDRCHRIGQERKVRVYRLVTAHSIESRILERANCKMKLGNLVLHHHRSKSVLSVDDLQYLLNGDGGQHNQSISAGGDSSRGCSSVDTTAVSLDLKPAGSTDGATAGDVGDDGDVDELLFGGWEE